MISTTLLASLVLLLLLETNGYYSSLSNSYCNSYSNSWVSRHKETQTVSRLYAKKKTDNTIANDNSGSSSEPRRVNPNSNVSVRKQIAQAKAYKRLVSSATSGIGSKVQHSYRKKESSDGKDDMAGDVLDLDNYDLTNIKPPAIFVDGYNVIGYQNSHDNEFFNDGINNNMNVNSNNVNEARDQLINDLSVLSSSTGWYIELVFDAYKVKTAQRQQQLGNLVVTYTSPSETADNYIERKFNDLKISNYKNMLVVTDDLLLRSVAGSLGVGYLSASSLVEEIKLAYQSWEQMEKELQHEMKIQKITLGSGYAIESSESLDSLSSSGGRRASVRLNAEMQAAMDKLREEEQAAKEEAAQRMHTDHYQMKDSSKAKVKKHSNSDGSSSEISKDGGKGERPKFAKISQKKFKQTKRDSNNLDVSIGSLHKSTLSMGLTPELERAMELLRRESGEK